MTSGFCSRSAWLDALVADLIAPPEHVDATTLATLWRTECVQFICERPPLMEAYPELSIRLRGAFGRQLSRMAARPRRGWDRPPPAAVLFNPLPGVPVSVDVPKPFVVRGHIEGQKLVVDLRLFGWAGAYLHEAAAAMRAALELGLALGPTVRRRVSVAVREVTVERREGVMVPEFGTAATLVFRTPVSVRVGQHLQAEPAAIIRSTVRRVAGLARWQGVALGHDKHALGAAATGLEYDTSNLLVHRWSRHSLNQGDHPIPMAGQIGTLRLSGPLMPLLPFLSIAAETNTGSHAALGLGWYDLAVY